MFEIEETMAAINITTVNLQPYSIFFLSGITIVIFILITEFSNNKNCVIITM